MVTHKIIYYYIWYRSFLKKGFILREKSVCLRKKMFTIKNLKKIANKHKKLFTVLISNAVKSEIQKYCNSAFIVFCKNNKFVFCFLWHYFKVYWTVSWAVSPYIELYPRIRSCIHVYWVVSKYIELYPRVDPFMVLRQDFF